MHVSCVTSGGDGGGAGGGGDGLGVGARVGGGGERRERGLRGEAGKLHVAQTTAAWRHVRSALLAVLPEATRALQARLREELRLAQEWREERLRWHGEAAAPE